MKDEKPKQPTLFPEEKVIKHPKHPQVRAYDTLGPPYGRRYVNCEDILKVLGYRSQKVDRAFKNVPKDCFLRGPHEIIFERGLWTCIPNPDPKVIKAITLDGFEFYLEKATPKNSDAVTFLRYEVFQKKPPIEHCLADLLSRMVMIKQEVVNLIDMIDYPTDKIREIRKLAKDL
jgi:hypothetical protein